MLTLVEYLLLLYRVLLPTPVWYRFFLNKEYGSLFSSLITGLYLTFKLTSVLGKVCPLACIKYHVLPRTTVCYAMEFASNNFTLLDCPGSIVLYCIESIITQRYALWFTCNIWTGEWSSWKFELYNTVNVFIASTHFQITMKWCIKICCPLI